MIRSFFNPDWAVHPGEVLKLYIEDHGLTNEEIALRMGVDTPFMDRLVAGGIATVDQDTAKMLETATGVDAEFWNRVEARYKKDVIRLTPKMVGLFDNLDSFTKVMGNRAKPFRNAVVVGILDGGDEAEKRMAGILKESDDFSILVELYENVAHFEITLGQGGEAYIALGPKLVSIVTDSAPRTAPVHMASKTVSEHPSYVRDYLSAWYTRKIAWETPAEAATFLHGPSVLA